MFQLRHPHLHVTEMHDFCIYLPVVGLVFLLLRHLDVPRG